MQTAWWQDGASQSAPSPMKPIRQLLLTLVFALSGTVLAEGGKRECRFPEGPSHEGNIFEPAPWPAKDLDTYAAGSLGVVRPTLDHFYLFIAYRNFMGLPIRKEDVERLRSHDPCWYTEARGFHGYEPTYEDAFRSALDQWVEQRKRVVEVTPPTTIEPSRTHPPYGYRDFLNCNGDAFRNAAKTLDNRLSRYGHSAEVLDWTRAQDVVFANCSAAGDLPANAPKAAQRWLQLDRDYQIAAAHFYAGRYDEAVKKFDAIASTPDSPWRDIAPYLAVRSIIRAATINTSRRDGLHTGDLAEAESRLQAILGKPVATGFRGDVERLLQFVQLRTRPEQVLEQLEKKLAAKELPESIGQDVTDYWLAYVKGGGSWSTQPFSRWLTVFRSGPDEAETAIEEWRKTGQLPWLVAALQLAGPGTPGLGDLLQDARKIPLESPAYISARYHLARLTPNRAAAIRIVDDALRLPGVSSQPQDANAFKRIGVQRATSITEFARFAPRASAMQRYGQLPNVDGDSVGILNRGLPVDALVTVLFSKSVPEKWRRELTFVVWTRAFVLNRWDIIEKLGPQLKRQIPQSGDMVDDLLREQDVRARRAIGAMLLARYPGIVGNVTDEITYTEKPDEIARANMRRSMRQDGTRDNWWCGFPNDVYWSSRGGVGAKEEKPASFLSPRAVEALRVERQKLRAIPNATDYLSKLVMDWAKTNPRDPRLPQALHMLVRSSRGGCVYGDNSAEMFRHLHRYFPHNPWTRMTRVHY